LLFSVVLIKQQSIKDKMSGNIQSGYHKIPMGWPPFTQGSTELTKPQPPKKPTAVAAKKTTVAKKKSFGTQG